MSQSSNQESPVRQFLGALFSPEPWTAARICRLLYNHNPFYLISAGLVIYGLGAGFGTNDIWINTTIPLTIMVVYASLLAGVAICIVRFGKVWEDARSILVTLAILFFAISAALDELLVRETPEALYLVAGAWLVVPILVELLRRGIGIRWPISMVAAFHAGLLTILAYPALPARELLAKNPEQVISYIGYFPLIAGAALLLFLPAVRKLAGKNQDNGTPWRRLHWVGISAVALGLTMRAYLLATAFYPYPGGAVGGYNQLDTAFGGWFCAPIILAILALVLEVGISRKSVLAQRAALMIAPLIIPLAMLGPDNSRSYLAMRDSITMSFASPVFLAGMAAIIFAAIAWFRRVRGADIALFITIFLIAPIGVETVDFASLRMPSFLPLLMSAGLCVAYLRRYRHSIWFVGAWLSITAAIATLTPESMAPKIMMLGIGHIALMGFILTGFLFRDQLASWIVGGLGITLPILAAFGLWWLPESWTEPGAGLRLAYLAGMLALSIGTYHYLHQKWMLAPMCVELTLGAAFLMQQLGVFLETLELRGSGRIVAGLCVLALAIAISVYKARYHKDAETPHDVPDGII